MVLFLRVPEVTPAQVLLLATLGTPHEENYYGLLVATVMELWTLTITFVEKILTDGAISKNKCKNLHIIIFRDPLEVRSNQINSYYFHSGQIQVLFPSSDQTVWLGVLLLRVLKIAPAQVLFLDPSEVTHRNNAHTCYLQRRSNSKVDLHQITWILVTCKGD